MPVGVLVEIPGVTQKQYDAVMKDLNWGDKLPPIGIISHVAGPIEGGWCVVDVWESREAFEKFVRDQLASLTAKAGMPTLQPKFFPVHNLLTERAKAMGQ